jgi:hypothetical protein
MRPARAPAGAYGALFLHTRALIDALHPDLDADVIAAMLLGAIAPPVLDRVLRAGDDAIDASIRALLRGITLKRS